MGKLNYFLLIILVNYSFGLLYAAGEDPKPVTIGGIFCLTGEIASGCNAIREGAEVALDLVNKEGGINGRPLLLDIQDSHYTPKGAHTLGVRFAADQNILGVLITGIIETKAAASVLETAKLSYITLWDSAPAIEALGDYSFGIGPWLPSTYEESAKFAYHQLKKKRAAIISTNAEWSLAVAKGFEDYFQELGGTITSNVSTIPQDSDFRSLLLRVLQTKPEVLYAPVTAHLIPFFRQLRQLGFNGPVITSDNLTEEILEQDKDIFEGIYQSMVATPNTTETKKLIELYQEKFSKKPKMITFHGWGYDGVNLMAQALRESDLSKESIRQKLLEIKDFAGASGQINFSPEGSWRMPLNIFKVVNGKLVKH